MPNSGISATIEGRSDVDISGLEYLGAFGVLPDGPGLTFQVNLLATTAFTPIDLANELTTSNQFTTAHANQSVSQIIETFYENVLGRQSDAAGITFWTNAVASGTSLGTVLYDIDVSPEGATHNDNGLHRYESLAITGSVGGQAAIDNSSLTTTNTVYVDDPYPVDVIVPTPAFQSHGALASPLLLTATGNLTLGDGTTPNSGLVEATSPDGFVAAMREAPRQSGNVYEASNVTTHGNEVTADYYLPAGTQSTVNGSFFNDVNHTAITQAFIVGSTTMTLAQAIAAGDTFHLALDQDGSAATNYAGSSFTGQLNASGSIDWINTTAGAGNITDNTGNANVAGNSTLVSFHNPAGVAGAVAGDVYTDKVWIENAQGVEIVGVVVNEHLVAAGGSVSYSHAT